MLKITITAKPLTDIKSDYCRLMLTEESPSNHRFVEKSDGSTEYRLGVGKWNKITVRQFRTLIRTIVQTAKSHKISKLAVDLSSLSFSIPSLHGQTWLASTITENLHLADYEFTTYKTKSKGEKGSLEITICGVATKEAKAGFARGEVVASVINEARNIANTPACDMTPIVLGKAAVDLMKGTVATVKVLGEKEITKLKMGLLLAVGAGTNNETKLIVAEYWGAGKPSSAKDTKRAPIMLLGKGITYDSGGLNVKPSGSMHDMHLDMSGGSSVLAAITIAAKLGLKKNIVAIVPAAENTTSDRAMRAGDIVTSMSGKTVEVLHTDAEGRLVLADAYTYAKRYSPRVILDVATLTGAALVALGQHASAIMTTDDTLAQTLVRLGEESGDLVWPLPLWDEYKQHIKSNRADVANIATNFSRFGGTIEGASFLSHFAPENTPWAHIDIAPRMDSIPSDKLAKGSTGEPIRLLVKFLETY